MTSYLTNKPNIWLSLIAIIIGIFPWVVYAINVNIGLSSLIDEGQMLLLLNQPKPIGHIGSQSGVITGRFISNFSLTASTLVWARFIAQVIAIVFLLVCSLFYFQRKGIKNISLPLYGSVFMAITSMGLYLFTKIISYNHVLQLTTLVTIGIYLLYNTFISKAGQYFCLFCIGIVSIFTIINIIPSGIAVLTFVIITLALPNIYSIKKMTIILFFIFLGMTISLSIFHYFFKNLSQLYIELYETFTITSKLGRSYDAFSLIFSLSRSILTFFVIGILSLGLHTLFEYIISKSKQLYWPYLITCISLVVLCVFSLKYTHKASLGLAEWSMSPLILALFYYYKNNAPKWPLNAKDCTIIFLSIVPIIASLGTNLGVASKFFYFIGVWVIVVFIVSDKLEASKFSLVLLIFLTIGCIGYGQIIGSILKSRIENSIQSLKLSRISGIYITPTQKKHFENLQDTLRNHGFAEGDTILAFQPDLMSVFVVGATAGRQVYFVPADYLANDNKSLKQPRFIILNEYSYGQVNQKLKYWGFPEKYHKINIGTPETENYFNADKPRMLFCLK